MTPKPGQVWMAHRDDREIVLLDVSGRQAVIRSLDDGATTTCHVTLFNRRGLAGFTYVRDATETERRQWGCA